MKNPVLEDIKKYAIRRLQNTYGFCGVAEGEGFVMINSGRDTNILVKIEEVKDVPDASTGVV